MRERLWSEIELRYHEIIDRSLVRLGLGSFHDRAEVWQETLLRAYDKRGTYDLARGSLMTWLWMIARQVARQWRRTRPGLIALGDQAYSILAPSVGGFNSLDAFEALVSGLQPSEVEVLREAYENGLTAREIAAKLGCSPKAVEHRLSRGKKKLREQKHFGKQSPRIFGGVQEARWLHRDVLYLAGK